MTNWAIELAEHWKKRHDIVHAFGIVLFTDCHPHIKKVLADDDYWAALDEISGPNWPVFSIKPRQGNVEFPTVPPGAFCQMVPVWKEPRENKMVLEAFDLSSTQGLPMLIVYCLAENKKVMYHKIKLSDKNVDEAYKSISEAIQAATVAVDAITPENSENNEGIYSALELSISSHKRWQVARRGWKIIQDITSLRR